MTDIEKIAEAARDATVEARRKIAADLMAAAEDARGHYLRSRTDSDRAYAHGLFSAAWVASGCARDWPKWETWIGCRPAAVACA